MKQPRSNTNNEQGMTLMAVMAVMAVVAVVLIAAAPTVYYEVQKEKELEAIRRGEEVAEAIREYVIHYNGAQLPTSIDDLLEGLPQGTKKRQILRTSAAVDPLSEDGKWRLIKPDPQTVARFAQRVQEFNNGVLPPNPSQVFDRYTVVIINSLNTGSEIADDEGSFDVSTDDTPFIGVASQSRSSSIIAYYGIEVHSSWVFTPLFRGGGSQQTGTRQSGPRPPMPQRQ